MEFSHIFLKLLRMVLGDGVPLYPSFPVCIENPCLLFDGLLILLLRETTSEATNDLCIMVITLQ